MNDFWSELWGFASFIAMAFSGLFLGLFMVALAGGMLFGVGSLIFYSVERVRLSGGRTKSGGPP